MYMHLFGISLHLSFYYSSFFTYKLDFWGFKIDKKL